MFLLFGCKKIEDTASPEINEFAFVLPDHFPDPEYDLERDPITEDGFLLGRKLFYDPLLSRDGSVSCNNCHLHGIAFADSKQHPVSIGVDNREGTRNAPPLMNLVFNKEFFWDGGVVNLDFVPVNAIEADFEMDETLANVVDKLNQSSEYRELFNKAFEIDSITSAYMLKSLSQFMNRMVSAGSKYDEGFVSGFSNFSSEELEGLELFESNCSSCHSGVLFTDQSHRNNGISSSFVDLGRGAITEQKEDNGTFKVPSLRNVEKTGPYMHNASFSTLEEVLAHYASGVKESATLDKELIRSDGKLGIELNSSEQEKIILFLKTLTDDDFLRDPIFAE